jgi:hypothetical protein
MEHHYLLPTPDILTAAEAKIITSMEDFRPPKVGWARLHRDSGETTLQSFDWCGNWWKGHQDGLCGGEFERAGINRKEIATHGVR